MTPADRDAPDGRPATGGGWVTAGAVLLLVVATAQIVYGVAAIGGFGTLEDNVREIESDPNFGKLYLSLGGWGILLILVGVSELVAAWRLQTHRSHGRLIGLSATLFGLAVGFFTLALFRFAAIATLALLFAALYVLSYRLDD